MLIEKNLYKTTHHKGWYISKSANDLMIEKIILIKNNEILFYIKSFIERQQVAHVFLYKTEIVYVVYNHPRLYEPELENIFEVLEISPM